MTTIRATVLHTPSPDRLDVLVDQAIEIDDTGRIERIGAAGPDAHADVVLPDDTVIVPGFVDTHLHAPQWPQLGTALDLPLDQWLFEYTFPLEARFADLEFARQVWDHMVPSLLRHGTTTVTYYASIHEAATTALAETCARLGQRAFVGRCAMDHPDGTPEWYRDPSPEASIAASARSIDEIRAIGSQLVQPIITPRFIPACTDEALTGLAALAADTDTLIQTHCSEGDWEHGHVLERCGVTDAHALDRFGLMREHTVLAHATHLDDTDRALIAQRGAGVAHCPLSNVYFSERAFSARAAIEAGVRVGLGTDIAGGPSPSLFAQCGHAMVAGRRRVDEGEADARVDTTTAFWMATAGGADLLGVDAGVIEAGRWFDAVAIRLPDQVVPDGDWASRFERLVRLATPNDIRSVWVAGRQVV
ncbi:amidohydrolase family protein [Ilumatobacter fluminis]|uniref:amidohydrolase family protein n=1 Tax=Ilumatobacter fluminis TaxID=467091 RepID=UPI001AAE30B1|nr:amidohydrolase family protein [Ilumatobacter fluminis]